MYDTKENIILVARDKCLSMCFPVHSNNPRHRAFRVPDDGGPYGFEYHGCSIEVHVNIELRRVKGTGVFARVPVLNIYGVLKDGRLHLIANKVSAIQGVVE
jgi:hypothetical protein